MQARYNNIAKNMEYSLMVDCDTAADMGINNISAIKICKHKLYGFTWGKFAHKLEMAKLCSFYGK